MSDITQEIIDRVNGARANNTPLNIIGGNSKSSLGRTLTGEPLHMSAHSGIVSYQPVELIMTARAGTPISEIEAALAAQGQTMAFEPPSYNDKATIGGTLACNTSGAARPWTGSVRDAVTGIKLINGKGELLNFGGQVLKNVAGYDASRLQAGALGTLGVITQVSFKVMPKPQSTVTLIEPMAAEEAIAKMNKLAGTAKPLTGACWVDNKLYLRLSGAKSAVEGTLAQWDGTLLEQDHNFWHALKEQQLPFFGDNKPLWRFSVNSAAAHFIPHQPWLIDWAGALRWCSANEQQEQMEDYATQAKGQVSLYRGGDRATDVFHHQPIALRGIQQRLKQTFDPQNIFNRGRLYSWL